MSSMDSGGSQSPWHVSIGVYDSSIAQIQLCTRVHESVKYLTQTEGEILQHILRLTLYVVYC